VRRPVLAGHQHQADGGLAHQEFTVEVVAPDLDDHRHQVLHAVDHERLLGQVDRADGAGLDRPLGVEAEVDVLRRAAKAVHQRAARFLRRHRRHVLLEHRQLACDLLGQEVGRGRSHLGHLDEERPEFTHHLRHDLGLGAVILGVGLEERLDVAQRPDLAADDLQVAAHHLHAAQQRIHAVLVAVVDVLQLVDHLDQQRLVGLEHQPRDVQPQIGQAAQFGVGHQLVEEGPELVDDLLRHRNRRARHGFPHHVADQALGRALVGQDVARAQVGRDGAGLLGQRVGVHRREDAVELVAEFGFREMGFTAEFADQWRKGRDHPGRGIRQLGRLLGQLPGAAQQAGASGRDAAQRGGPGRSGGPGSDGRRLGRLGRLFSAGALDRRTLARAGPGLGSGVGFRRGGRWGLGHGGSLSALRRRPSACDRAAAAQRRCLKRLAAKAWGRSSARRPGTSVKGWPAAIVPGWLTAR
jgi:hypothetical protein